MQVKSIQNLARVRRLIDCGSSISVIVNMHTQIGTVAVFISNIKDVLKCLQKIINSLISQAIDTKIINPYTGYKLRIIVDIDTRVKC